MLELVAERCFHVAAVVEVALAQTHLSAVEIDPLRLISAAVPAKAMGNVQLPADEE